MRIHISIGTSNSNTPYKCEGKTIRQICHLSIKDMPHVYKENTMADGRQNCFIANKFDMNVDTNAVICTAKRIHLQEYMSLH